VDVVWGAVNTNRKKNEIVVIRWLDAPDDAIIILYAYIRILVHIIYRTVDMNHVIPAELSVEK